MVKKKVIVGRQIPTESLVLAYKKTYGKEAIKLYNSTDRKAQKWQELLLQDILAINNDELYVHTKFGYSVPRRNGKNEIVAIREMFGLKKGERIIHTAHRTSTTHSAWERLMDLLTKAKIEVTSSYRAFGKEHIETIGGGKIEFRTRTSKGGLGEGFDLLVIDEAQEYQDDHESALKYVVSDSKNPQTIFCGTPPTPISSGTVFTKLRENALAGKTINSGWAEWAVDNQSDPNDRTLWYKTNPSLGSILSERKIQDEVGSDEVDFNIQRLGLWIKYNQKSAISENEWKELKVDILPKFKGKLFVGVKYGVDTTNVALSIAIKTSSEKIFVETIDCKPVRAGNSWIIRFLKEASVQLIAVDGQSGQNLLATAMKEAKIKKPILPTVTEIKNANADFEQGLFSRIICHKGQPSLSQIITNCEKRAIGNNGGFGYKSLRPQYEIALMDSAIIAYWLCSASKEKKKQRVNY